MFHALFEGSNAVMVLVEPATGRIVRVNQAAVDFYGYSREQFTALTVFDFNASPPDEIQKALASASRKESTVHIFRHRLANGEIRIVEVHGSPVVVDGLTYRFSIIHDITDRVRIEDELMHANQSLIEEIEERKRMEEALRQNEARYRALFENSMDAIFLTVPDGATRAANRAACEMFGMTEEELIQAGRDGISDPNDSRLSTALDERARKGRIFCELVFIRKDGTRFPCETSSCIVDDGSSSFVMLRDITGRKQAEETLRNYTRRLIELEEELRKKLAVELHDEIGRDLTALGINCSIISDSMPEETAKKIGKRIEDSGRLIEEVTRTVRNIMSRLRPPMLDDYGLASALRWYADLFSRRTGITPRILIDETCPRLPVEKETALFRIAQEALTNTAKHACARNTTVFLGCRDGMLLLSIADDGKGFIPGSASLPREGSGWGLTIMRERAELFGGIFRLDSEPGMGTVVTVEIGEV